VTVSGTVYVTLRSFAANGSRRTRCTSSSRPTAAAPSEPEAADDFHPRRRGADQSDPVDSSIPQSEPDDPGVEDEGGDAPGNSSRDCGDFDDHCTSGFTFFRRDVGARSTADQLDALPRVGFCRVRGDEADTVEDSDSTYSTAGTGNVGQSAIYYSATTGRRDEDNPGARRRRGPGHQLFPDISADGGVLHASGGTAGRTGLLQTSSDRSATAPDRSTVPALDVYAKSGSPATGFAAGRARA
jgi:hypothetical protein